MLPDKERAGKLMPLPILQNNIFEQNSLFQDMESRLIVKNFGPIKSVDLKLKNVNVFIGQQSTGKSALAKIYTIFKAPRKFFYKKNDSNEIIVDDLISPKEINDVFDQYNIGSFLKPQTEIKFVSELHEITLIDGLLKYQPKVLNVIRDLELLLNNFVANRPQIVEKLEYLDEKFIFFRIGSNNILFGATIAVKDNNWKDNLEEGICSKLLEMLKNIEDDLSTSASIYIPAERNFINIIRKYSLNLQLNEVPIPRHILSFGAELEKSKVKELDLGFIQDGLKFKIVGEDELIYINNEESIMLTEAASGIQSIVPLLASVKTTAPNKHRSYVIEEPELNLFPTAQYNLIKFLESTRREPHKIWEDYGTMHIYTTHSPYILSSLNNFLYAHKVFTKLNSKQINVPEDFIEKYDLHLAIVKKIVHAIINPVTFTAYQIFDGQAESIMDEETGLIKENFIDMASDKIDDDFNELMDLIK